MVPAHRQNIILYNVLNQEVIFEEYFCNLLSIQRFRELFLEFIAEKNQILITEDIKYNNFNTEISLNKKDETYGRADLFLKLEEKEFIFEIKNKDWTDLTENQPAGYLNYLNNKNEHLFFLIPKGYKHKDEIFDKWERFNGVEKQIFYWQDFILKIKDEKFEEIEIKMFYDFCIYWFNMIPIHFTETELKSIFIKDETKEYQMLENTNIPTIISKLYRIVENAQEEFSIDGKEDRLHPEWYGYVLNNKKYKIPADWQIWFGIDFELWEKEKLPIVIQITPEDKNDIEKIKKAIVSNELKYDLHGSIAYVWLEKETFQNENINIAEQLKEKIRNIIDDISKYQGEFNKQT